jgi:hypothetical protein
MTVINLGDHRLSRADGQFLEQTKQEAIEKLAEIERADVRSFDGHQLIRHRDDIFFAKLVLAMTDAITIKRIASKVEEVRRDLTHDETVELALIDHDLAVRFA